MYLSPLLCVSDPRPQTYLYHHIKENLYINDELMEKMICRLSVMSTMPENSRPQDTRPKLRPASVKTKLVTKPISAICSKFTRHVNQNDAINVCMSQISLTGM